MTEQVQMKVYEKEGMVVLGLPKKMDEISMHPDVAGEVAQEISNCAGRGKLVMMAAGTPVTDIQYKKITNRVRLVMENLDKRKISRARIAKEVVDIVLAEVL